MGFQRIYSLSSPIINFSMLNLIVSLLISVLVYFQDKLNLTFQVFFSWWSSFTGLEFVVLKIKYIFKNIVW